MTFDLDRLHELVITESFSRLTALDALLLIGLLYTHRMLISRELRRLAVKAFNWDPIFVEPLDLRPAAELVASWFGFDVCKLLHDFERHWLTLREGARVAELKCIVEAHRCVEKLVPYPQRLSP